MVSPSESTRPLRTFIAMSCMVDDRVGTIEPSKEADILVVDTDQSRVITAIGEVVDLFKQDTESQQGHLETGIKPSRRSVKWPYLLL